MVKFFRVIPLLFILSCTNSNTDKNVSDWVSLWNGEDLTGWNTYFASPFSGTDKTQEGLIGLNNPSQDIIKVVELEDGKAIRVSGIAWGMMFTEKDYSNYHLKLKVKWGKEMHVPRENGPRDSGLLYHGYGEPGSASVWMSSQELQIQEGDFGDYWPTGDVAIDIPTVMGDSIFYKYEENAELRTYYTAEIASRETVQDSLVKRRVVKSIDAERPNGQWNDVELYCFGNSSVHIVNGEVVMRLYNSRKMSNNSPVKSGKIILQSEGAEVYYKDIKLRPIDVIPEL